MDWFPVEAKNYSVSLFNNCIVNVLVVFRGAMKLYGVLSMKLHKNETLVYIASVTFKCMQEKAEKWSSHLISLFSYFS